MKIPIADLKEVIDGLQSVPLLTGWANAAGDSSQFIRMTHAKRILSFALTGTLWAGGALTVPEDGNWTFYIDRRALTGFLKTAGGKEVDLTCDGKQLLLKASGQKMNLANHDKIGGYEVWHSKATITLPDPYVEAMPMLLRYCPTLSGMSHVDAVFVSQGYGVIATDTIACAVLLDKSAKEDCFLPHDLMDIFKDTGGNLCVEPDGVGIEFNHNFVYQPLNSGLQSYPIGKIRDVLKAGTGATVVGRLAADKLQALLETLSTLAIAGTATASVKTSAKKDSLICTVDLPGGQVTRTIGIVDCKAELQPVALVIRRLLPWVEHVAKQKQSEITFKRLSSATVLQAGNYQFMMSDI